MGIHITFLDKTKLVAKELVWDGVRWGFHTIVCIWKNLVKHDIIEMRDSVGEVLELITQRNNKFNDSLLAC